MTSPALTGAAMVAAEALAPMAALCLAEQVILLTIQGSELALAMKETLLA
jgi:hypothetical protein